MRLGEFHFTLNAMTECSGKFVEGVDAMRIFLADDQSTVRSALRLLLEQDPSVAVVGEAREAQDLLTQVRADCPDLLLLDWELPALRPPELLSALRSICPDLSVVALSSRPDARRAALASGANAFVSKGDAPELLLEAVIGCQATNILQEKKANRRRHTNEKGRNCRGGFGANDSEIGYPPQAQAAIVSYVSANACSRRKIMQNGNIIQATGVHKTYDTGKVKVHALRGVDLNIKRGEMVAVMGPSGCGKTTLLNVLSGLDGVTEGQVVIDGAPIHTMSDRKRTRYRAEKMGFVFQSFNLLPVLSAVENVELPLLMAGVKPGNARRRAQEALDLVGLAGEAYKRPAEMSGGQQQRVTIARSLANDPAIVWADEPTGSLDSETSAEVVDLLCGLNKEKSQTFVLVTHDIAVGRRADRILRMADGVIVEELYPNGG